MSIRILLLLSAITGLPLQRAQIHSQALPSPNEPPLELRARKALGGSAIELILPKSDIAGVVELYGASEVERLYSQPDSIQVTNTPTSAGVIWRLPLEQRAFYRAKLRVGATLADYLPKITTQPRSATVDDGASTRFSVTTEGTRPLSYQWQLNGANLLGETGPSLTVRQVSLSTQGAYWVVVSNPAGTVTSDMALLTVRQQAPTPTAPPGFLWIPPSTFMMGSPTTEPGREDDELLHAVELTQGFFMGRFEVTQTEYTKVMGTNPSFWKGDQLPVERVTWHDATNYCNKLTDRERIAGKLPAGWEYRLPTEAQWEYACRAGTTTATAYGHSLSSAWANFYGWSPYNGGPTGPNLQQIRPVGSYAPNAWGLYDMHGNVWEWCADWYDLYSTPAVKDPKGPNSGVTRVYRGGSWADFGLNCRSATRIRNYPQLSRLSLGFRVVLVRSQSQPEIIVQPQATTIVERGSARFSITAVGTPPLSYQWQFNGRDLKGEQSPTVTLDNVSFSSQGGYGVIVSNANGVVSSDVVQLKVMSNAIRPPSGLVWIPRGTFVMGSQALETDRGTNEMQYMVSLSGFLLGRYEVTQKEYTEVTGTNPSFFKGDQLPVERVTWHDATNYCNKLTVREKQAGRLPAGWEYRLPTEAQWEYACRATTTTATAYGNRLGSTQANFNGGDPYNGGTVGPNVQKTRPVGSYAPNAWGLYDMHGNIVEWCLDGFGLYPTSPALEPRGATSVESRVFRGGGWRSAWRDCRSAYRGRGGYHPGSMAYDLGFRVALVRVH